MTDLATGMARAFVGSQELEGANNLEEVIVYFLDEVDESLGPGRRSCRVRAGNDVFRDEINRTIDDLGDAYESG